MSDNDCLADPGRFMRMPDVARRIGRSPRQVYRMIKAGEFPKGHRQSHRVAVWYEREVKAWQREQVMRDLLA